MSNIYELRQAEKEELKALQTTMTTENMMEVFEKTEEVRQKYRILRKEHLIITSWGFPTEEWATLSKEAKILILDMADEADRYQQLREELQAWIEEAP
jgi:hypothetical protein